MNKVIIENKNGRKKEFKLLLELVCENNRKYIVFTDERVLNDGSLHTIVTVLNSKNKVMKSKPTPNEMKYIEKFLLSLCSEV